MSRIISDEELQACAGLGSRVEGVLVEVTFQGGSGQFLTVPRGESMHRWAREYALRIEGKPMTQVRRVG